MQVLGTFHKRKSVDKLQPEMPKRKISGNSRTQSKRNHRTQYKSIDSPQAQLKNYKRKNLSILKQLQTTNENNQSNKTQLTTNRTQNTKLLAEQSITYDITQRKTQNYSVNSLKQEKKSLKQGNNQNNLSLNNKNREQMTSSFTINQFQTEDKSLTSLINNKTNDSNPFINTARLKQEQNSYNKVFKNSAFQNNYDITQKINQSNSNIHASNTSIKQLQQNINVQQNNKISGENKSKQNKIQQNPGEDEQQQKQYNEGQNFDDYQFGGQNSISNALQEDQQAEQNLSIRKSKKSNTKIMPVPKVQSYTVDMVIQQKPQNWRQMNRYIPQTESEHRMALQHISKQKQALQIKRQQQQIVKLIQQYHINKNSINLISQRKIETSKIMQKIYKDKKLSKQSVSLPQLKSFIKAKKQIIIPDINAIYAGEGMIEKLYQVEQKFKINNTLATNFRVQRKNRISQNIKTSLSYSKLGFGSSGPRLLNQEDIKQNQLENIEKIQKKLRQKGISFDSTSIRKGLLNIRDAPIYKISSKHESKQQIINEQNKLDFPKKQLPSNGFYKFFPL